VPFELRTGKALKSPHRRIAVHFKAPGRIVPLGSPSVLAFEMAPDQVSFKLEVVGRSGLPTLERIPLLALRAPPNLPPSARMIRDVLVGDPTLAVRDDEVEHSWRIIDSVLNGWRNGAPPLQDYPAGSAGPECPSSGAWQGPIADGG
jgi:glucose-6-phosphate 1-dehydrogenase